MDIFSTLLQGGNKIYYHYHIEHELNSNQFPRCKSESVEKKQKKQGWTGKRFIYIKTINYLFDQIEFQLTIQIEFAPFQRTNEW